MAVSKLGEARQEAIDWLGAAKYAVAGQPLGITPESSEALHGSFLSLSIEADFLVDNVLRSAFYLLINAAQVYAQYTDGKKNHPTQK